MSITPREPADFTPSRGNYTELKPFRFWCQKVLPLVYDDSLSYYELLCKVVDFLNKTMEDVETLEGDVTSIYTAYNDLQTYVNEYFSTLDVQEEINNKLDEMASDGSLTALLVPFLPTLISEWLSDHITPTTPIIDDTLTIQGAGADSKTVGDALHLIDDDLKTLKDSNTYTEKLLVYGENRFYNSNLIADTYIRSGDGEIIEYNGWSTTNFIPVTPNTIYNLAYYDGAKYVASYNNFYALYDENFNFIRTATQSERESTNIVTTADTAYIRTSQQTSRFDDNTMLVLQSSFSANMDFIPFSVDFINNETESIKEEINDVKNSITNLSENLTFTNNYNRKLIEYGENRFYNNNLIANTYIRSGDGEIVEYNGWSTTDFIPVEPNTIYNLAYYDGAKYVASYNNFYALYDENFNFIRTATQPERESTNIVTTADTAYIRTSQQTSRFNNYTMLILQSSFSANMDFIPFSVDFINNETESIKSEINNINNDIIDIKKDLSVAEIIPLTLETGKRYEVINGELVISTDHYYDVYQSCIIPVVEGDIYLYSGRVYNYARQYSLIATNDNNVPLKYELNYETNTIVTDYEFSIPTGATKLIVQSYSAIPTLKILTTVDMSSTINEIDLKANKTETQLQYDNIIRSIERIGLSGDAPQHSIIGYKNAYKDGFRILLCDLRFTSDNVPVLFHDSYLNQNYRNVYNSNGQPVSTDPPIYINQNTYEYLNQFDYGYYKGEQYINTPLLTLEDMVSLCKSLGVELYIEIKEMNSTQANIACSLVNKYGISERVSWCGTVTQLGYIINVIPSARVGTMPSVLNDNAINEIVSLKTNENKVFAFGYDTTVLDDTIVNKLIQNNIAYEVGTLNTESAIINYLNQSVAYKYCTGIESNTIVAGKAILDSTINS